MEYITLNNQVTMPILGLGTYKLKGESGIKTIKNAINLGYTLIDRSIKHEDSSHDRVFWSNDFFAVRQPLFEQQNKYTD